MYRCWICLPLFSHYDASAKVLNIFSWLVKFSEIQIKSFQKFAHSVSLSEGISRSSGVQWGARLQLRRWFMVCTSPLTQCSDGDRPLVLKDCKHLPLPTLSQFSAFHVVQGRSNPLVMVWLGIIPLVDHATDFSPNLFCFLSHSFSISCSEP